MEARKQCWVLMVCIVLSMCLITTSATVLENLLQGRTPNMIEKRNSNRCLNCGNFNCVMLCMDKRNYDPAEEFELAVQQRTEEEPRCILDEILQELPENAKAELFDVIMRWVDYD
ncbi:uncharacterized protein LOC121410242 [Lytechinus variegatus]|uniref:uncharacterized protein LOC121410242 n=1 Tax=Lytechinus variegatus TaxID=7654 RepID=UPI001BB11BF2|nr:uncharacterized protein LOC121410242 [Lytechinus variegatus]